VSIGHIDDGLPLPGGKRFRDIRVRLETDSLKDDVRLDGVRQCFGNDRGADRGHIGCHTYSAYTRGLDGLWGMYQWLDRAPRGRNEAMFRGFGDLRGSDWYRRHDEYDQRSGKSQVS
jgi:predicted dithiol-disulfide oxidoreductase (DUF899 family)